MKEPQCFCDECEKAMAYAEARIVKLLEELFDKAENAETRRLLIMGIALIKGEQE